MNLGKGLISTISVIAKVCAALGVILIIAGFANIDETSAPLIIGLVLLLDVPFLLGFRYIVMAACRYLETHPVGLDCKAKRDGKEKANVKEGINEGDNVVVIATGQKLTVQMIEGDKAFCVGIGTAGYVCHKLNELRKA